MNRLLTQDEIAQAMLETIITVVDDTMPEASEDEKEEARCRIAMELGRAFAVMPAR